MIMDIIMHIDMVIMPAIMHMKRKSEDTLALNTIRQFFDAKELYFTEDGAGQSWANVPKLVKAGYASHSLDVATQHNIGAWNTTSLRVMVSKPGDPVKIHEISDSGSQRIYGRVILYPTQ
jgi:hypothetical protein